MYSDIKQMTNFSSQTCNYFSIMGNLGNVTQWFLVERTRMKVIFFMEKLAQGFFLSVEWSPCFLTEINYISFLRVSLFSSDLLPAAPNFPRQVSIERIKSIAFRALRRISSRVDLYREWLRRKAVNPLKFSSARVISECRDCSQKVITVLSERDIFEVKPLVSGCLSKGFCTN